MCSFFDFYSTLSVLNTASTASNAKHVDFNYSDATKTTPLFISPSNDEISFEIVLSNPASICNISYDIVSAVICQCDEKKRKCSVMSASYTKFTLNRNHLRMNK